VLEQLRLPGKLIDIRELIEQQSVDAVVDPFRRHRLRG